MEYLLLKTIHIISSTLLFGTGLGSAFYLWRANKSKHLPSMLFAAKNVVIADWIFTTPSVIIQPITGFWMIHLLHYPMTSTWIIASLLLYVLVGACWVPVVWMQIKMYHLVKVAVENHQELSPQYFKLARLWFILGWPAFIGVIVIFYLMVFKP